MTAKRNRLLRALLETGKLDSLDFELACDEPLPGKPMALPQEAPHLTEWHGKMNPGKKIRTTLDFHLQRQVEAVADRWNDAFSRAGIHDLSARENLILMPLVVLTILFGIYPKPILDMSSRAVAQVVTTYSQAK